MKVSKEDRKLFDRLNKRYKVFQKRGVSSNLWEMVKNEIVNVYLSAGVEMKGNFKQNVFSMAKEMDPEVYKQLKKIAEYAESTKSSSFNYYKKTKGQYDEQLYKQYQTIKEQKGFYVNGLQDYIDFIDDIENGTIDKELWERLGSKLYNYFKAYCKYKKISKSDYDNVVRRGLATSLNGDPLYNWLRNEVDRAYSVNNKTDEINMSQLL